MLPPKANVAGCFRARPVPVTDRVLLQTLFAGPGPSYTQSGAFMSK